MTSRGRRIHFCFILAGILASFVVFTNTSLAMHVLLIIGIVMLIVFGILGAIFAAALDLVFRTRRRDPWWPEEMRRQRPGPPGRWN